MATASVQQDEFSVINLDEPVGKWVGRKHGRPPQEEYARLLRLGRPISGGRTPFPRGVVRFESHEQANAWIQYHILKGTKSP